MSTARKFIPRYTVDDYSTWEGDWELWDGIAVSMSPSPFGAHQLVLFNLAGELRNQLRRQNCDAVVLGQIDWIISRETVVRPDVIVLCGEAPERHVETTPALVAEILSPSTAERDRTFKRDLYDEQNVNVYLIIDPVEKTLLAHRRDDAGSWQSESVIDEIEVVVCGDCSATIRLENIF